MKAYLAGPMRQIPEFNFPAFDHYAGKLKAMGFDVINPADLDRASGFDPVNDEPDGAFLRDAMARDLMAICRCDAIALMPGWEKSDGARVELSLANVLKLDVIDAETGERMGDSILDEAKRLTTSDRHHDYGHPSDDFGRTAKFWSVIFGVEVTAEQCVQAMIALKLSRLINAYKRDSVVDIAGYANLLEMMREREATAEDAA